MSDYISSDSYKTDPDYHQACEILGINKFDRYDFGIAKKVSLIWEYLQKRVGNNPTRILKKLYDLKSKSSLTGSELANDLSIQIKLGTLPTKIRRKSKSQEEKKEANENGESYELMEKELNSLKQDNDSIENLLKSYIPKEETPYV